MVFDLNLKSNSQVYHGSMVGKDTAFPRKAKETRTKIDKSKGNHCGDVYFRGLALETEEIVGSRNNKREPSKKTSSKDHEVIKYMFSLPAYLQRMDSGEGTMGKAFNVGVLDWSRLETLTGNDTGIGSRKSCTSEDGKRLTRKTETRVSYRSKIAREKPSAAFSAQISRPSSSAMNVSTWEEYRMSSEALQHIIPKKSVGRDKWQSFNSKASKNSYKSKDGFDQSSGFSDGFPCVNIGYHSGREETRRGVDLMTAKSLVGSSYDQSFASNLRNIRPANEASFSRTEISKLPQSLGSDTVPSDSNNPILGSSKTGKVFPTSSISYKNREDSDQSYSKSTRSSVDRLKVPGSFQLPASIAKTHSQYQKPCICTSLSPGQPSVASTPFDVKEPISTHEIQSCQSRRESRKNNVVSKDRIGAPRAVDNVSVSGKLSSPSRHFGFSVIKLTRSFSFKENSSGAPLADDSNMFAKSGPITSDSCGGSDDFRKQPHNTLGTARASPFRRILDPLLKFKGSRSSQNSLSQNNLSSESCSELSCRKPYLTSNSPKAADSGKSFEQAQLQLMVQNGCPLFRFMVNNSPSVFAATKAIDAAFLKTDSGSIYTIYSVEEIKKRTGTWRHVSNKEKNGGHVYNIVGQMKLNNSAFVHKTSSSPDFSNESKESVLYGIDRSQEDISSTRSMASKELAAMIIMTSNSEYQRKARLSPNLSSNIPPHDTVENKHDGNITVLLPGAVHSIPNKGGPSPLIQRWKTGGLCDCGGWDVGCKLNVLSNASHHLGTRGTISSTDHLELFCQEESLNCDPIFSLSLVEKGHYSVKFCSSISLLQAFFISMTAINYQTPSDNYDKSSVFDESYNWEFNLENVLKWNRRSSFQGA